MRVLVTGADGFVGQHVLAELLRRGHGVVGGIAGERPAPGTLGEDARQAVEWARFDLRDASSVERLVTESEPDAVVHLAAASSVFRSWQEPEHTFEVNTGGTLKLLLAVGGLPTPLVRRPVLLVGSGEAYGRSGTEADPLTEALPLRPTSPYAASKAAQEMLGWAFGGDHAVRMIQTRTFPHLGPGQAATFVAPDWAVQLLAIERGERPATLRVGNLDVVRDFLDVRDGAAAYADLLETDTAAGVYNVCSGRPTPLRTLLEALVRVVGVQVTLDTDPARLRPADIPSLVGDPTRLIAETGWRPHRTLDDTLRDLVAHLRAAPGAPAQRRPGSESREGSEARP